MTVGAGAQEEGAYKIQDDIQMKGKTFNPSEGGRLSGHHDSFKGQGHGIGNGVCVGLGRFLHVDFWISKILIMEAD